MNNELSAFIVHARQRGMDHATIRMLLLANGWRERDIVDALAGTVLEVPVPAPPDTGGAREAFLHLLVFASLYAAVIATVVLAFRFIDRLFPDPAFPERLLRSELSTIRWSVAVLLVAFPFFIWLSQLVLKEIAVHPERSWSPIRRWLTYLTLFVAAIALGGDLITLVFYLLEGELSTRFVLKVLAVLLIAGLVFVYYVLALRLPPDRAESQRVHRIFGWAAGGLIAVTLTYGFALTGSPGAERTRKLDDRRVGDLTVIHDELVRICVGANRSQPAGERTLIAPLPATLDEVREQAQYQMPDIVDPQTGEPYGYEVTGDTTFRLCATFNSDRHDVYDVTWNHPAGRHCFAFDLRLEE